MEKIKEKFKFYLDKLTELTGIDMRYVAKGSSWSSLDLLVGNVGGILSAMAFARFLPQEVYGTYSFILSWMGVFSVFAISGINSAVARSIAMGYEGDLQLAIKYKIKWGIISSAFAFGFSAYYLWAGNNTIALSFAIVGVFLPPYLASSVIGNYFFVKELFKNNFIVGITIRSFSLLTMISAMIFTKSAPVVLLAYFVPDTIINFLFIRWAIKRYQTNKKTSENTKSFALHLTAMNILGGVSKRLDSILLFHFIGAAEVAIYKFALFPFSKLQDIIGIISGISGPRFARRSYKEIYEIINKKLLFFNMGIAGIGLLAFILMPLLFKILFPQYSESVFYARMLLLPLMFSAPAIMQSIWSAKMEIKKLYILKIITHVSRIGVFAVAIPLYGMAGAVWSQIIIAFAAGAFLVIMFYKDKNKAIEREDAEKIAPAP